MLACCAYAECIGAPGFDLDAFGIVVEAECVGGGGEVGRGAEAVFAGVGLPGCHAVVE
jgi:hypothetical protein